MRVAPFALAVLLAQAPSITRAFDEMPSPEAVEARAGAQPERRWRAMPRWGFALGAGFPDFATASLMFRPLSPVRVWAGPAWNTLAFGVQGGVALVPWRSSIAPVVSLEAGRFFRSDLSFLAKDSGGVPEGMRPLLDEVDYTYAALGLGLDLGNPRGLSVGLRVGLSYVSIGASGTASFTSESGSGAQVRLTNPSFHGTLPSVKLGVQYWF